MHACVRACWCRSVGGHFRTTLLIHEPVWCEHTNLSSSLTLSLASAEKKNWMSKLLWTMRSNWSNNKNRYEAIEWIYDLIFFFSKHFWLWFGTTENIYCWQSNCFVNTNARQLLLFFFFLLLLNEQINGSYKLYMNFGDWVQHLCNDSSALALWTVCMFYFDLALGRFRERWVKIKM